MCINGYWVCWSAINSAILPLLHNESRSWWIIEIGWHWVRCSQEYESKVFSDFIIPRLGQSSGIRLDCSPLESSRHQTPRYSQNWSAPGSKKPFLCSSHELHGQKSNLVGSIWSFAMDTDVAKPRAHWHWKEPKVAPVNRFLPSQSGLSRHNANEAVPSRQRFHAEVA